MLATLAARELGDPTSAEIRVLDSGTEAWRRAGLPAASSSEPEDKERIDFLFWNHARHAGNLDAMRAYLQWELDLPPWIAADGTVGFRIVI